MLDLFTARVYTSQKRKPWLAALGKLIPPLFAVVPPSLGKCGLFLFQCIKTFQTGLSWCTYMGLLLKIVQTPQMVQHHLCDLEQTVGNMKTALKELHWFPAHFWTIFKELLLAFNLQAVWIQLISGDPFSPVRVLSYAEVIRWKSVQCPLWLRFDWLTEGAGPLLQRSLYCEAPLLERFIRLPWLWPFEKVWRPVCSTRHMGN